MSSNSTQPPSNLLRKERNYCDNEAYEMCTRKLNRKQECLGILRALFPPNNTNYSSQKMMPQAQMPLMGTQAAHTGLQERKEVHLKFLPFTLLFCWFQSDQNNVSRQNVRETNLQTSHCYVATFTGNGNIPSFKRYFLCLPRHSGKKHLTTS